MIRRVALLSTGDELVTGRTVDTNANFITDKLVAIGLDVVAILVVGDYPDRIRWAWEQALDQADVVLSTGGLGPTADDRTTETIAALTGRPLLLDESIAERIRQMFAAMGRVMPENNLKQAHFPEGATVIPNALGTAPGFRLAIEHGGRTRHLVVLPGVPREMKPMLEQSVIPWLQGEGGTGDVFVSRVFQTFGLSESALDEMVARCISEDEARIAFRAAFPQISVRLTVQDDPARAAPRLEALAARLRAHLGEFVYGEGDTNMETVVGHLLAQRGLTLALAESCTGGLVGDRITDVPGSSAWLLGGVVAYSNAAKVAQLGVAEATLERHGAVSEQTAEEMAIGARRAFGSDLGLAITGIAGPDGGTAEKPVGTVCFALASSSGVISRRYKLWGTRDWVKILSSQVALDWVRRHLLGMDPLESGILKR
jgi:nicotinamide-nucleotide amidase